MNSMHQLYLAQCLLEELGRSLTNSIWPVINVILPVYKQYRDQVHPLNLRDRYNFQLREGLWQRDLLPGNLIRQDKRVQNRDALT